MVIFYGELLAPTPKQEEHSLSAARGVKLIRLRIGTDGGHCECGSKPLGSTKCGGFLDQLRIYLLFKDSAPWKEFGVKCSYCFAPTCRIKTWKRRGPRRVAVYGANPEDE